MTSEADDNFIYSYSIVPLPATPRSGWRLRLYEHRTTLAERHFPTGQGGLQQSMDWWQTLTDVERAECMGFYTCIPDAYIAHLSDVAYAAAETDACAWLNARTDD